MSPLDDELRRTLDSRADRMVTPADPLAGIEARARGIQRRRQAMVSGGVAAAVLALAVVVPLAGRERDRPPIVAATPTPTAVNTPVVTASPTETATPTPTASATPTSTPTPTPSAQPSRSVTPSAPASTAGTVTPTAPAATPTPAQTATVAPPPPPTAGSAKAIYYVGDADGRALLYREFRRLESPTPRSILQAMVQTKPMDPDYQSLWPAGSDVLSATLDGDVLTVDLKDGSQLGRGGSEFACLTLQQLVWTATAAEPRAKRVLVTVAGRAEGVVSQWWDVGCGDDEPIARRAPSYEVLAPVQISSHNEGDPVRATFTLAGEATVFEATVSWSVVDKTSGDELAKGFATATAGAPARGTWTAPVTLSGVAAGQVLELRAWSASAEDGRVTFLDTKTVVVR